MDQFYGGSQDLISWIMMICFAFNSSAEGMSAPRQSFCKFSQVFARWGCIIWDISNQNRKSRHHLQTAWITRIKTGLTMPSWATRIWCLSGVVTFTERLVTHLSGNKTHEAGGHYANDGPYLCPDTSSEKYKWRRNTLCHTQPVARLKIWGLELSLKMFTLTKRGGLIMLVSFSYSSNMFTIFEQVSVYDHQTWGPVSSWCPCLYNASAVYWHQKPRAD